MHGCKRQEETDEGRSKTTTGVSCQPIFVFRFAHFIAKQVLNFEKKVFHVHINSIRKILRTEIRNNIHLFLL